MTNINDNGDMILDLKTKILILRARDFAGKNRTKVGMAKFIKFNCCDNWRELKESMLHTAKVIERGRDYD